MAFSKIKNEKTKLHREGGLLNNSIKVVHRRRYAVEVCDARNGAMENTSRVHK